MSDLIERQAAIDAIIEDKICDDSLKIMAAMGSGDKAETLNMTCDRHVKMLMSLPSAQPEPKWNQCSEKLPEESGYCIITAHDGVGHRTTFAKFQKKAKSWDLTGARSYWRAIAWMPLPEPYKEGETT